MNRSDHPYRWGWLSAGAALGCSVWLGVNATWTTPLTAAGLGQPPAGTTPEAAEQLTDQVELTPTDVYAYDSEGRRDPFVSLLSRGTNVRPPTERPPGLPGLSINDVSLRGIVASGGSYLAVMQAPDDRTYILRGGEDLFDAVVRSISAEGVVFLQEVNDPLSLVNEREVLRTLQGQEEGR